jgi:TIR domain
MRIVRLCAQMLMLFLREQAAMQTVSIRNLRGNDLRGNALKGMPLAITNGSTMMAVFVPVTASWVEHLIDYNWSHVYQDIVEGERALPTALPALTLDEALNPSAPDARQESRSADPAVITVRVGELSGSMIEKTGAKGQFLAVTHDRELIGVIVPITRSLINFLIELNMSRILYNISLGERHIGALDKMTMLDETLYRVGQGGKGQGEIFSHHLIDQDREVADNQQELAAKLPIFGEENLGAPRYKPGQRNPAASAGQSMKPNISRVFLCHSSSDKPSIRSLRRRLLDDDIQPWFDEEDILPGQDWELAIRNAIRGSDVVLVCLSRASVSKVGYLQKEIKHVLDVADEQPEGTIFLIPVRLEPCDVPERLRRWQWVDMFEENGYPRLLRALRMAPGTSERMR